MDYTDILDECVKLFGDDSNNHETLVRFDNWKDNQKMIDRLREGIELQPKGIKSDIGAQELFHQERVLKNVTYLVFISIRGFLEESARKQYGGGRAALYVCSGYYIASVSVHDNVSIKKREEEWKKRRSIEKEFTLLNYENE